MRNLIISLLVLYSLSAYSNEVKPVQISSVVPAKPLKRANPKYPRAAAIAGQEGWVKVNYSIKKDGTVGDLFITDSSGLKDFERAALRATKSWKFEPATENGEPVEQCRTSVLLEFRVSQNTPSVTRKFYRNFKKAEDALNAGNLEEAKLNLDTLNERPAWNMTESNYLWYALARYHEKQGNKEKQLHYYGKLLSMAKHTFDKEQHLNILFKAFALATNLGKYSKALDYYAKLEKVDTDKKIVTSLSSYKDEINALIEGKSLLSVDANISQRGLWSYHLLRSQFELANIDGKLHSLDIRCENRHEKYTAKPGFMWKIPKSWQGCSVLVKGEEGTQFNLIEVPDSQGS